MKCLPALLSCILFLSSASAQKPAGTDYPKGYFRYPLDIPPKLNANFGEMRPNHFHMGLDLFTQRKENLPIYAAAEGYVSRVKIEPGGFGNAIYIAHPNGLTTLYAHMNDFMPALQQFVKEQQYRTESWEQDLAIPAGKFPLKKGDFIGYSGNTGGSQGPHVHFEIRETASEKCLNGLLFGFNIPDQVPPVIYKIGVYDKSVSMYETIPIIAVAQKSSNGYRATVPAIGFEKVQIALHATDAMTGVPNPNGIYKATLYEGEKALAGFAIDKIGYDETRMLNAHIDYKTKMAGGSYLQYLLPLTGDALTIYPYNKPGDYIFLKDTLAHSFRIEVMDAYGNKTDLHFTLKKNGMRKPPLARPEPLMRAGEINVFETEQVEVFLPEKALYDSIYFRYGITADAQPNTFSPIHNLHQATTPLQVAMTVKIKPSATIPYHLRDKILMKKVTRGNTDVSKANWEMGKYVARFRDFGSFQLVADDQPPLVSGLAPNANLSKSQKMVLYVKDNYQQIKNFRAELDGKWLRFVRRGNSFTYVFDEKCDHGEHVLSVTVEDEAGNKTKTSIPFKR